MRTNEPRYSLQDFDDEAPAVNSQPGVWIQYGPDSARARAVSDYDASSGDASDNLYSIDNSLAAEQQQQTSSNDINNFVDLLSSALIDEQNKRDAYPAANDNNDNLFSVVSSLDQDELLQQPLGQPSEDAFEGDLDTAETGEHKRYTLLEDSVTTTTTTTTSKPPTTTTTTTQAASLNATTHEQKSSNKLDSMFHRLTHYLPFLHQLNMLREPQSDSASPQKISVASLNASDDLQPTKQSVSKAAATEATVVKKQQRKQQPDEVSSSSSGAKEKKGAQQEGGADESSIWPSFAALPRVSHAPWALLSSSSLKGHQDAANDDNGDVSSEIRPSGSVRASALKLQKPAHSHLLSAHDERADDDHEQGASYLGKYVYAPEHHYHLSTAPAAGAASSEAPLSVARRMSAGSHVEIPAQAATHMWAPMWHTIAATDAAGPLGRNQSNDFYFLVLVGAVCGVAMAMVLVAGLFVYRVQQDRKSNSDADYPTYGVVGPNNAAAMVAASKACGQANLPATFHSFYHSGNCGAPGSSMSVNKMGGVARHLPDLYTCSDSGINSKRASSSDTLGHPATVAALAAAHQAHQHQLQHHQQHQQKSNSSPASYVANQNAAKMYHYQHQKQQMIISDHASAGRHTSASDLDDSDEDNEDGSYTVYECPGLASAHDMEIKNPLFNDDRSP